MPWIPFAGAASIIGGALVSGLQPAPNGALVLSAVIAVCAVLGAVVSRRAAGWPKRALVSWEKLEFELKGPAKVFPVEDIASLERSYSRDGPVDIIVHFRTGAPRTITGLSTKLAEALVESPAFDDPPETPRASAALGPLPVVPRGPPHAPARRPPPWATSRRPDNGDLRVDAQLTSQAPESFPSGWWATDLRRHFRITKADVTATALLTALFVLPPALGSAVVLNDNGGATSLDRIAEFLKVLGGGFAVVFVGWEAYAWLVGGARRHFPAVSLLVVPWASEDQLFVDVVQHAITRAAPKFRRAPMDPKRWELRGPEPAALWTTPMDNAHVSIGRPTTYPPEMHAIAVLIVLEGPDPAVPRLKGQIEALLWPAASGNSSA